MIYTDGARTIAHYPAAPQRHAGRDALAAVVDAYDAWRNFPDTPRAYELDRAINAARVQLVVEEDVAA